MKFEEELITLTDDVGADVKGILLWGNFDSSGESGLTLEVWGYGDHAYTLLDGDAIEWLVSTLTEYKNQIKQGEIT